MSFEVPSITVVELHGIWGDEGIRTALYGYRIDGRLRKVLGITGAGAGKFRLILGKVAEPVVVPSETELVGWTKEG